ncbi:peptidylprolyl isomerase [Paraflavitalea sp. CAU 1676]|uniref:peptidylprolyl isomerase n=1 Tax=Paraflavitalea sp. CAU 1676 TaxID=3032598 RepID=UPI0023DAC0CE|nr:peptidylprolyl isomerase [Paraflavitalea sp. CAU 1676]MDF2191026.1 SurA N-terminal domain-containing protein [Paraflavitalea sp. CAU 1676]
MAIIQTIRDKAAWIIIAAIALALIAFIVQDAFSGRGGGLFSGPSTTLGKINGKKVDYMEFEKRLSVAEANYAANGQPVDENFRQQIRESLWNEYVENAILDKEMDKLGFEISDKEKGDILYGVNPPQQLRQQFTNPQTGVYDANEAHKAIRGLKKGSPEFNNFWGEFVPALAKQRIREKFVGMIGKSYYVPKWLIEKRNNDNSQIASISYVNVPYASIADSTVKVSDDDIRKFVDEHKEAFKQEKSRGVEYVLFNAAPSTADSAAVRDRVEKLKDSFATISDIKSFLLRENSQAPYYASNITRKEIKIEKIDSIAKTPVGGVYGPYLDGNSYALARMVSVKQWPDTVKVRHILVATHTRDQRSGEFVPVRLDSTAKRIVDSVEGAIRNGANFDTLCAKYSDDGNKDQGGVYDNLVTGRMTEEFNNFIFDRPTGSKGVVKTEFGYHYIEVLSQKGSSPAYNIAYFSQPVYPSDLTTNTAHQQASSFAAESRSRQQFEDNIKKQNLTKFNAYDISPLESNIPGLGTSRELVRWIYNDAKVGDVSAQPFFIGDKYIVPVLVNSYEKGTMSVERARPLVEYRVRNQKKAEQIAQKVGTAASLDAVTKAMNQPVQQLDSIQFSAGYIQNLGNESKLIGASFNKNYQSKVSDPIFGEMGVFYIKVNNISALPSAGLDIKTQQQMAAQQIQRASYMVIETLKRAADITDNRYKFY